MFLAWILANELIMHIFFHFSVILKQILVYKLVVDRMVPFFSDLQPEPSRVDLWRNHVSIEHCFFLTLSVCVG